MSQYIQLNGGDWKMKDRRMSNNLVIKIGDVAISIEGKVSGEIAGNSSSLSSLYLPGQK